MDSAYKGVPYMPQTSGPTKFSLLPNFSHAFQNLVLPYNQSYVELPEAKAGDLTYYMFACFIEKSEEWMAGKG